MKMGNLILIPQMSDILNNLANIFGPVPGGITFTVITKLTPPPITPAGGKVR